MFRYTSQKPVRLVAYNICGGIFCIKREGFGSYGIEEMKNTESGE
ncbi:MAG TPA: hypothetical protein VNK07_00165 [Candidatus Binatia bacterium]|nr:hypothetical protein [Candidatus Binatia bacterium]